jgi:hypothetical protein
VGLLPPLSRSGPCAHLSLKAAPNKAQHDPRQTMNCQLHIVTSFVGPTQRKWSGAAALDGAQSWFFRVPQLSRSGPCPCAHVSPNAAPNKAHHAPRQTMNCQLHIVTSFVGPTQRKWSGAPAAIVPFRTVCSFITQGCSKQGTA